MFGEKKTGENVQCLLLSKLYLDFFVLVFHFHQFYYNAPLILLVKVILIRNRKSSGALIPMCR